MYISGLVLQIMGVLVLIGGSIYGLSLTLIDRYAVTPILWIVASVTSGVFIFGIGALFKRIDEIAENIESSARANQKTAVAMQALTERRNRPQSQ